jgi:DNA-binding LacI/PurR family transcriptional regulator
MLVYQVEGQEARTRFLRELPARRKVDALILTALPMAQVEVERLDLLGVHVVVAGGTVRDYPHVMVDDLGAGRSAMRHLIDLGHRRIAMIRTSDTDGTTWSSDLLRMQAWREALEAAGLVADDQLLVTEPYDVGAGARAMARLLALAEPPTAVFAYSDELAFAAIAHARASGVRVPEDLSVIGFDGHPLGELLDVTTIDQDVSRQGRLAAEIAVRLVGGAENVSDIDVECRLIDRGSTSRLDTTSSL